MRASFAFILNAISSIHQSDASRHLPWLNSRIFLQQDPTQAVAQSSDFDKNVDYSECTCSCCEVAKRTPEEIEIQSVYLKCAQKFTDVGNEYGRNGKECTRKCAVTNNLVLPAGTSDKGINYDRFCFYYCQPFDTEVTGPCVRQNATEQMVSSTSDGNGEDLHLPSQGASDILKPHPKTTPPPPPTMEEMPCEERENCIETLMADARLKAENTWKLARDSARAARAAAAGDEHGENVGAHETNPGPGIITGEVTPR